MTRTAQRPRPPDTGRPRRGGGTGRPRRSDPVRREAKDTLAARWEKRLTIPVIVAALVAVPAVFLTMLQTGPYALVGRALNWASVAVLGGETLVLIVLSGNKRAWIRRHLWPLAVVMIAVPAAIWLFAPMQALRLVHLVRLVGTLRILRAKTIVTAGHRLARRFGLTGPWRWLLVAGGSVLAAAFVAIVLVDPTSYDRQRRVLEEVSDTLGTTLMVVAGVILAGATFVVVRYRRRPARPRPGLQPEPEAPEER